MAYTFLQCNCKSCKSHCAYDVIWIYTMPSWWRRALQQRKAGKIMDVNKAVFFFKYLINQHRKCLMRNKMHSVSLLGLNDLHNVFVR